MLPRSSQCYTALLLYSMFFKMLANLAFLMEYSLRLQCNFMSNNLNFTAVLNKSLLDCKFSCFSVPFVGKIQNSSRYCIETAC